jgi:hypothetical protein
MPAPKKEKKRSPHRPLGVDIYKEMDSNLNPKQDRRKKEKEREDKKMMNADES